MMVPYSPMVPSLTRWQSSLCSCRRHRMLVLVCERADVCLGVTQPNLSIALCLS